MSFVIATDVGGTCTDTVIVGDDGSIHLGKVLSTPPNFAAGVIDSVESAADGIGLTLTEVLSKTRLFVHGSTVVDNTLLTRSGAKTGLVTTRGFEDTLRVTRGAFGRWGGLNEAQIKHPVATDRAVPLASPLATYGVTERVDYKGEILEPLDETQTAKALATLIGEQNLEAVAVSLLWSFKNDHHENTVKSIIRDVAPGCHVSLSSEIAPVPGEYERTSTTVINAYAGKVVKDYITDLEIKLRAQGYTGPLLIMQGHGGLLNAQHAADRAVSLIECGPVAGLIGSKFIGERLRQDNVIAVDMGGTTSKVGVIQSYTLSFDHQPMVDRFHYSAPKIEVVSIGAGGGSLITLEAGTNIPQVGPESAGSVPGPICYGNGGTTPTLTDVMLIIGYMAPEYFLGGQHELEVDASRERFTTEIANPLGLSMPDAAAGIFRIACSQMSDLIHQITVERGLDPREFVLHAFGGTCPMLASTFAEELQVKKIVIPYTASVNCAFGMTTADVVHEFAETTVIALPASPGKIAAAFEPLLKEAEQALASDNFQPAQIELHCSVGMRYRLQVHELFVPVPKLPVDDEAVAMLMFDFERLYEQRYGEGSAYKEAGMEITQCRVSAHGVMPRPELFRATGGTGNVSAAKIGTREIFVEKSQSFAAADIYDFSKLHSGHVITGPAVIHTPVTTIVVQARQKAVIDEFMNTTIEFL
ncbi:MAG: hydantoinase/oxoprolinase family protein [Gammaproteobacteria bacterium]